MDKMIKNFDNNTSLNKADENTVIKDKKFKSRANYAGNDEVIDLDRDKELDNSLEK